jgi:Na+/H+-dicarboxylate symporter
MADFDPKLANRILWGLVFGAVAGALVLIVGAAIPAVLEGARWLSVQVLDPLGQVFLRLLFFVVMPLVFASLALGVAQLSDLSSLGPLAGKTFGLFAINMSIGVALGLLMMNVVQPGATLDTNTKDRLIEEYGGLSAGHIERQAQQPDMNLQTLVDMFMPRNLLGAVAGFDRGGLGEVLPLILFSILVGAAALRLTDTRRARLHDGLEVISELMTGIVRFALKLAPYAVPAMIFSVVVKIGWDILIALGVFVIGCIAVMLLHLFGVMSLWVKFFSKITVKEFWQAIRPAMITAFSTSSSSATLPTSLAAARMGLGVSAPTAGFVLPLGATMNMAGTALYEGCVVLFVAQVFGVPLDVFQQLTLLVLAVLGAVAVASIPGGSLPIIAGLLITFGVPAEGIGIVLGADRLLDMTRTMVNVGADLAICTVVDKDNQTSGAETPNAVTPNA